MPCRPGMAGRRLGGGRAGTRRRPVAPERVAGLVVMGTAVSGAPDPNSTPLPNGSSRYWIRPTRHGTLVEINRLETWLWLDGPGQPEGRVGGAARQLALDMNAIIIGNDVPETAGAAGVDTWTAWPTSRSRSPSPAATSTCPSWWIAATYSRPGFPLPGTTC